MRIGHEMLTLADQHQAMYFSLEMVPSIGPAGNNPQLPSPQLKRNMLQFEFSYTRSYMAMSFNERSWKAGGCPDYHL